jgi:hypothetical protein
VDSAIRGQPELAARLRGFDDGLTAGQAFQLGEDRTLPLAPGVPFPRCALGEECGDGEEEAGLPPQVMAGGRDAGGRKGCGSEGECGFESGHR